ncbi:hypothetical protein TREMEDRAFT_60876 [Tremella mesenterica DSM 1558]|uniref:uncharacterized protein n=1 Tax=Tremella mesenterica (strain ATCC 24925 / CBS 8224 / DSM 1558 / NBRC 9311 / NRRL Y-6157 / RJB 2259-6 / UBC 559-6) TaxID=578456 RepID=UPI0003F4A4BB|nr:uncharacterized protein TREMEDRAFT_60876 [Tremella mesenterica DSM 1558]EIW70381.1 hypothetical protein TREMEDRAFT_60876 [Tremella mesenterica DSM 1558]
MSVLECTVPFTEADDNVSKALGEILEVTARALTHGPASLVPVGQVLTPLKIVSGTPTARVECCCAELAMGQAWDTLLTNEYSEQRCEQASRVLDIQTYLIKSRPSKAIATSQGADSPQSGDSRIKKWGVHLFSCSALILHTTMSVLGHTVPFTEADDNVSKALGEILKVTSRAVTHGPASLVPVGQVLTPLKIYPNCLGRMLLRRTGNGASLGYIVDKWVFQTLKLAGGRAPAKLLAPHKAQIPPSPGLAGGY